MVRVDQTCHSVAREGQRKIAIGAKGSTIKVIGEQARKELETAFDRRVHLFLHVKVRENWGDDPERFREMGLEFGS